MDRRSTFIALQIAVTFIALMALALDRSIECIILISCGVVVSAMSHATTAIVSTINKNGEMDRMDRMRGTMALLEEARRG